MLNNNQLRDELINRSNYIKKNSFNNKKTNEELYKIGMQKNREYQEKLRALNSKGGISSAEIARTNILLKTNNSVENSFSSNGYYNNK